MLSSSLVESLARIGGKRGGADDYSHQAVFIQKETLLPSFVRDAMTLLSPSGVVLGVLGGSCQAIYILSTHIKTD